MLFVLVDTGRRGMDVPKGTKSLVERYLQFAGFPLSDREETWTLRLGPKVKGTTHRPEFKVLGHDDRRGSIAVYVKPGSNDSAHECGLVVPNGYSIIACYKALEAAQKRNWAPEVVSESPQATIPVPETIPVTPVVPVVLSQPVTIREQAEMQGLSPVAHESLRGFSEDPNQFGLVLILFQEKVGIGEWISSTSALELVKEHVMPRVDNRSVGRALGAIARNGYLEVERNSENRPLRFRISPEGEVFLRKLSPMLVEVPQTPTAPETVEVPPTPTTVLESVAVDLSGIANAIDTAIAAQEEKIALARTQLKRLRDARSALVS